MSYQTEEQQIEQLKEWWKDNGTPLIVGAVLGLSGFFGYRYWTEGQIAIQESASEAYTQVSEQIENKDTAKLVEAAQAVKTQFPKTSYAILSALQLAKAAVDEKNLDKAMTELTWVVDNHSNNELVEIAKIRLARILIAQEKADQALPLLTFENESGYFEFASMIKGDALLSLGKKAEALEAYRAAESAGKTTASHPTMKLQIEALAMGEVAAPAPTSETTATEIEETGIEPAKDTATETKEPAEEATE
ncbi:MAG: tetratricopeptide repeat protein [Kangiellaceae bacterium]|nr:tetratricopeptide repeat protein [Kangiellaceae bacterium]